MEYEIYTVANYKIKREKYLKEGVRGDINKISEIIKTDKSYHEILYATETLKINTDIDGCEDVNKIIMDMLNVFNEELELEIKLSDIKYTENKKYGELHNNNLKSHHICISLYCAKSEIMKEFWEYFEMKYKHKLDNGHLGTKGKLYRLPNQTKGESDKLTKKQSIGTEHIIINGTEKDFILKHIEESINIDEKIKKLLGDEKKIKNTEKKITRNKKIPNPEITKINECTLTDDEIKITLEKLDKKFVEDYTEWLKITTILKNLNKYEIWDEWSKKSVTKYNKEKNDENWNNVNCEFDENLLKYFANIPLTYYREYKPLTKAIKEVNINSKYLSDSIKMDDLKNKKGIIIQSCVGTGKSHFVAKYVKKQNKRVISIVSRKSLAEQHISSFNEHRINLVSYKNENKNIINDNLVFCINSLMVLSKLKKEDLENTIIYLDETTSLLKDLTQNITLKENLREIYNVLRRILKNCNQVICTDAIINDNVFSLLENIPDKIFIKNKYKKYKNIKAYDMKDENAFLEKIKEDCKNKKYFLFGCDSLNITNRYYNECVKIVGKENCILISSETPFEIINASEDFKGKFVFYTPSIIFGVDFNIETTQNVFIYITGKTLMPDSIFQQTTRTRNMNVLYYYCEEREIKSKYKTLENVYEKYKNIQTDEKIINSLCTHYTDDGVLIFEENTFFKLFCYEKWVKDTYKTNLKMHYENILRENEFIIIHEGETKKINPEKVKEMKTEIKEQQEKLITEYIEKVKKKENTNNEKFTNIKERIEVLCIPKKEIEIYKNEFGYSKNFINHRNLILLLKEDEYIDTLAEQEYKKAFAVSIYNSTIQKIKLIKTIEKTFNIHFTNNDFNEKECQIKMDKKMYEELVKIFRTTKKYPETYKELLNLYIGLLKNVTGVKFIISQQERSGDTKKYIFTINKEILKHHLNLNKHVNTECKFIQKKILKFLNINVIYDDLYYD